ncbi:hypothetical protein U1Q18_023587 [Sarracenia purpurea var. burkii]
MDGGREEGGGGSGGGERRRGGGTEKTKPVEEEGIDEALKKCLEGNEGESTKCKTVVEAFKSSSPPSNPTNRRTAPLRLMSGSLTDV